jgi:hypothetical protein
MLPISFVLRNIFWVFHPIHPSCCRDLTSLPFPTVRLLLFLRFPRADASYQVPLVTPTSSPILLSSPRQELILFVGYPCLGKTSFYRRYFQLAGYVHINQDTLRTRDKCVKAAREILQRGESCVIGKTPVVICFSILTANQIILIVML